MRVTLLRAHPLLTHGKLRASRLGGRTIAATLEGQRVFRSHGVAFGPAAFMDVGRTWRRLEGDPVVDTDVGVGLRARLPGLNGVIRVDVAKGLRDGAGALSFVYEQ
jgi:hypothetical protein